MTTNNINKVKQTLGFFSMTIAWALMNLSYSIDLVLKEGKASDIGVIIFWSGFLMTIAWAIFIIFPLHKLNHSRKIFNPLIFPFVTTAYGALAYVIVVGALFRHIGLILMFLSLALSTGFIFGLSYSLLIKSDKLVGFLNKRPIFKLVFFFSPVIILFFFFWVLPAIAPSMVFRYMPEKTRSKIIAHTIPKFKVGDDIEPLKNSLPGLLDNIQNGKGNMSSSGTGFSFVLQVNCGKIIRLEYGKNPTDFDGTIYGELEDKPCPK